MLYSNAHTHSVFCDGKDTIEHMAQRAYEFGLKSLGYSGHSPQSINEVSLSSEQGYVDEVRRVAALYEGRMKIWLGIEHDYYGTFDLPVDYRLGAVHYVYGRNGIPYAFDHNRETFEGLLRDGFGGDVIALAKAYYDLLQKACDKLRPDIIAHYDLICKFNEKNDLFDEHDPAFRKVALDALEGMCDGKRLLEVNTGAIGRGFRTRPYPTLEILTRWRELGGRVIFGSDCHDAEKLLVGWRDAMELMKAAGYKSVWRLGTGDALFEEDPLA